MKEIQAEIKITVREDGETLTEIERAASLPVDALNNESDMEMTEDEAERYAVASDLANVCDYLEDSEVIKIRLIIQKAQTRKERAEHEQ